MRKCVILYNSECIENLLGRHWGIYIKSLWTCSSLCAIAARRIGGYATYQPEDQVNMLHNRSNSGKFGDQ